MKKVITFLMTLTVNVSVLAQGLGLNGTITACPNTQITPNYYITYNNAMDGFTGLNNPSAVLGDTITHWTMTVTGNITVNDTTVVNNHTGLYEWLSDSTNIGYASDWAIGDSTYIKINTLTTGNAGGRIIVTFYATNGTVESDTLTVIVEQLKYRYHFNSHTPISACAAFPQSQSGYEQYFIQYDSLPSVDTILNPVGSFVQSVDNSYAFNIVTGIDGYFNGSYLNVHYAYIQSNTNAYCGQPYALYDSIPLTLYEPPIAPICIVTVDTASGHNLIVWEKHDSSLPFLNTTTYYEVAKLNDATSEYESIGQIDKDSLSQFLDINSNPAQQSATYVLWANYDSSCNGYGYPYQSDPHTTIHLSANLGTGGQVNLIWNAYVGFNYNTFSIYRSNNGGAFTQIGNAANTATSYSDLTPPSGTNLYYVAVSNPHSCTPTRDNTYSATLSNILNSADIPSTPTGITSVVNDKFSVFPNPFTDKLTLSTNISYQLFDMLGREVDKNNLTALPAGTYILKTEKGSTRVTKMEK